jgi:hypothetical protein
MNYIDQLASRIRAEVPPSVLPDEDVTPLFRGYAVLLLALGSKVTAEDVHNAWAAWMAERHSDHPALVPFKQLDPDTIEGDSPFLRALRIVASQTGTRQT